MAGQHDWSKPPFYEGDFRATFWKPFLVTAAVGLVIYICAFLVLRSSNAPFVAVVSIVLAIATGLMVGVAGTTMYPTKLTASTISGMTAYGTTMKMSFEEIQRVTRPWYGLGIYWILHSQNKKLKIWLPVCQANPQEFLDALEQLAGPGHPLTVAVADGQGRQVKRQ
jgi:hypothetical protein